MSKKFNRNPKAIEKSEREQNKKQTEKQLKEKQREDQKWKETDKLVLAKQARLVEAEKKQQEEKKRKEENRILYEKDRSLIQSNKIDATKKLTKSEKKQLQEEAALKLINAKLNEINNTNRAVIDSTFDVKGQERGENEEVNFQNLGQQNEEDDEKSDEDFQEQIDEEEEDQNDEEEDSDENYLDEPEEECELDDDKNEGNTFVDEKGDQFTDQRYEIYNQSIEEVSKLQQQIDPNVYRYPKFDVRGNTNTENPTIILNQKKVVHPERKRRKAYQLYLKKWLPGLRKTYPELTITQIREKIRAMWKVANENPFNNTYN